MVSYRRGKRCCRDRHAAGVALARNAAGGSGEANFARLAAEVLLGFLVPEEAPRGVAARGNLLNGGTAVVCCREPHSVSGLVETVLFVSTYTQDNTPSRRQRSRLDMWCCWDSTLGQKGSCTAECFRDKSRLAEDSEQSRHRSCHAMRALSGVRDWRLQRRCRCQRGVRGSKRSEAPWWVDSRRTGRGKREADLHRDPLNWDDLDMWKRLYHYTYR